jgi:hypothetical protein
LTISSAGSASGTDALHPPAIGDNDGQVRHLQGSRADQSSRAHPVYRVPALSSARRADRALPLPPPGRAEFPRGLP